MDVPEEIIEGCRKGNNRSQEKLYKLVAPNMYGLCFQYAGNEEDAKDIMQEGFIKAFNKIQQFSGKGSIIGWIRRIMINTALEKYRSQMNMYSLDDSHTYYEEAVDSNIVENMEAEEIIGLIQQLTPRYRLVFNLYVIEGFTHREISQMTGISEGTSKSNLSRARIFLQKRINEMYEKRLK